MLAAWTVEVAEIDLSRALLLSECAIEAPCMEDVTTLDLDAGFFAEPSRVAHSTNLLLVVGSFRGGD